VSTLKVNAVIDASGGNTATINNMTPTADSLQGFRNRIINGAMVINQRSYNATPTTGGTYTLDRWFADMTQASKYSVSQNAGSVTPPVGYNNYLGVTSTSAYSVLTGDYFAISQAIEGFNIVDLGWGAAGAKAVTLSFQVYSSLTGTFGGSLWTSVSGAYVPFSYSIPVSNTWTTISVTLAGPTIGSWNTTNGIGIYVNFSLGAGSTYTGGTAGTWSSTLYVQPAGCVNLVGTNGATFYLTGVQLEVGSVATPFERRPYGAELALCQRYYRIRTTPAGAYIQGTNGQCISTTRAYISNMLETMGMRAAPTATFSAGSTFRVFNASGSGIDCTAITANAYYQDSPITAYVDVASGLVAGDVTTLVSSNGTACTIQASAEL
jgi:hypothetical protein